MLTLDRLNQPLGDYLEVEADYAAIEVAAMVDLSSRGALRFTGPDRAKWLQGLVSNDVLALKPGQGHETLVLEIRGHIVAHMRLYNFGDYLLADLNAELSNSTIRRLDFFRIMEKVELQEVTADYAHFGVFGQRAREVCAGFFPADWQPAQEFACATHEVAGAEWLIVNSGLCGEPGLEFYVPPKAMDDLSRLLADRARLVDPALIAIVRIEHGRPWQPMELNEKVFPQEACIEDRAVSFTKGCYVGQETVARIHARGHVNRKLTSLRFDEPVPPGARLLLEQGKEVGQVTSVCRSPRFGLIGLGYLRCEHRDSGTIVSATAEDRRIPTTAVETFGA